MARTPSHPGLSGRASGGWRSAGWTTPSPTSPELYRYIAADSPKAAAHVVQRIQAAVRVLAEMPHRGRPGRWPGTRELVIPRTPYIVPYRVQGDLIEILRLPWRPPLARRAIDLTAES